METLCRWLLASEERLHFYLFIIRVVMQCIRHILKRACDCFLYIKNETSSVLIGWRTRDLIHLFILFIRLFFIEEAYLAYLQR